MESILSILSSRESETLALLFLTLLAYVGSIPRSELLTPLYQR
ncbi:MAG: hypothetical protein ACO2O0_08790 [Desulfurococcales archaeon]